MNFLDLEKRRGLAFDEPRLGAQDFAENLGTSADFLQQIGGDLVGDHDFRYAVLNGPERDEIILNVLKKLAEYLPVSGKDRIHRWEEGWAENLRSFVSSGFDPRKLIPGYYRSERRVMRLSGEYVLPTAADFEINFFSVLRSWVFHTFLASCDHVYEFGCGPAHNLFAFAEMAPEKYYHGLDWAAASKEIIDAIRRHYEYEIDGCRFDMFSPDHSYILAPGSAVTTFGALEQLGNHFDDFLDYLLAQPLSVCVHVEPICELYNSELLFDYLALRYHLQRGYLSGFLTKLRALEGSSRVEILHVKKNLGSLFHDGWCTIAWRPR